MNLINSQSLYTIIQRLTILGKDKFIEEEEARYARQIVSLADEIVENGARRWASLGRRAAEKPPQPIICAKN